MSSIYLRDPVSLASPVKVKIRILSTDDSGEFQRHVRDLGIVARKSGAYNSHIAFSQPRRIPCLALIHPSFHCPWLRPEVSSQVGLANIRLPYFLYSAFYTCEATSL